MDRFKNWGDKVLTFLKIGTQAAEGTFLSALKTLSLTLSSTINNVIILVLAITIALLATCSMVTDFLSKKGQEHDNKVEITEPLN